MRGLKKLAQAGFGRVVAGGWKKWPKLVSSVQVDFNPNSMERLPTRRKLADIVWNRFPTEIRSLLYTYTRGSCPIEIII